MVDGQHAELLDSVAAGAVALGFDGRIDVAAFHVHGSGHCFAQSDLAGADVLDVGVGLEQTGCATLDHSGHGGDGHGAGVIDLVGGVDGEAGVLLLQGLAEEDAAVTDVHGAALTFDAVGGLLVDQVCQFVDVVLLGFGCGDCRREQNSSETSVC